MHFHLDNNIDARDVGTAVPNGVRLPPITTTTKANTSASVEASKRPRAHEKDRYDFIYFTMEKVSGLFSSHVCAFSALTLLVGRQEKYSGL